MKRGQLIDCGPMLNGVKAKVNTKNKKIEEESSTSKRTRRRRRRRRSTFLQLRWIKKGGRAGRGRRKVDVEEK